MTTAVFIKMIVSMTDATCDQEHMPIVIEHCPYVPDRTAFILDPSKPDPVEPMIEAGKRLAAAGASEVAIPCFTAHYFHQQLESQIPIPVINGVEEVVKHLKEQSVKTAGVMATDGTVRTDIFGAALEAAGIACIYPDEANQKKVMSLIYDHVKANKPVPEEMLFEICDHLKSKGADRTILGCTELSVAAEGITGLNDITDALEILSAKCIRDFYNR